VKKNPSSLSVISVSSRQIRSCVEEFAVIGLFERLSGATLLHQVGVGQKGSADAHEIRFAFDKSNEHTTTSTCPSLELPSLNRSLATLVVKVAVCRMCVKERSKQEKDKTLLSENAPFHSLRRVGDTSLSAVMTVLSSTTSSSARSLN
jgi:hypothetical protein